MNKYISFAWGYQLRQVHKAHFAILEISPGNTYGYRFSENHIRYINSHDNLIKSNWEFIYS